MTDQTYPLCHRDAIPEDGARGFTVTTPSGPRDILVVRRHGRLYAYVNSCPHTGVNLDWVPDRFLDRSGEYLQCATHGALFQVDDGFCVRGPCAGQSLRPVSVDEVDGEVTAVFDAG